MGVCVQFFATTDKHMDRTNEERAIATQRDQIFLPPQHSWMKFKTKRGLNPNTRILCSVHMTSLFRQPLNQPINQPTVKPPNSIENYTTNEPSSPKRIYVPLFPVP